MEPAVVYSPLGWFYIIFASAWSLILIAAMAFLFHHRRLPFLQLRKLPLLFTAVILLHIYAASCFPGPTVGSYIPCDAQFWVMSIYLPFGMALLQVANSQFLHVASQQRKYASLGSLEDRKLSEKSKPVDTSLPWWKQRVQKFQKMDKTTKTVVWIGVGMLVELALTFLFYFGSESFHLNYGIFKLQVPMTEEQRAQACVKGWEWWLSIVWQFFWAWLYAPYLLWKSRHIRDTHGWRIQTIGCCLAGLPASPLWLAGLYIPEMTPANAVVPPSMWIGLSIIVIEIFVIFFPCWQVFKTHSLKQETLDAIAAWEERNSSTDKAVDSMSSSSAGLGGSTLGGASVAGKSTKSKASADSSNSRKSEMFTMVALENALRNNPQPLLEFAALKDFSGENVSFLSHVAEWKRRWTASKTDQKASRSQQFIQAVRIYSHFVSLEYSEFPVNISSKGAKELFQIFDAAAHTLNRRRSVGSDSATPFDDIETDSACSTRNPFDLEGTLGKANLESVTRMSELNGDNIELAVPESFTPQVFDSAEGEIKYLVLTNTWPKFVIAGIEMSSSESLIGEKHHFLDGARSYFCGLQRIL